MTMPKAEHIPALTAALVERAREVVAKPDDMDARKHFLSHSFNIDFLAAKIVYLADAALPTKDGEAS